MPTADPAQQRALLDVQAIDTQARQAAHRATSLPEHEELRTLGDQRTQTSTDLDAANATVAGLEKDLRRSEAEVEEVRTRIARDQSRLDAGTGGADVLTRLQHEIGTLTERQSTLEDAELEVMEALETATGERDRLQSGLDELDARITTATAGRDAALAEVDAEQARLASDRNTATAGIDPGLLALYDKILGRTAVAAAELTGNRCGGCRMELSPVDLNKAKAMSPESVAQCEECGAILVR